MGKHVLHFKTQAEFDAYWAGVDPAPTSMFECIIEEVETGTGTVPNMVLSTSNNTSNKTVQVAGSAAIVTVQQQGQEVDEALQLSEWTLEGQEEEINPEV